MFFFMYESVPKIFERTHYPKYDQMTQHNTYFMHLFLDEVRTFQHYPPIYLFEGIKNIFSNSNVMMQSFFKIISYSMHQMIDRYSYIKPFIVIGAKDNEIKLDKINKKWVFLNVALCEFDFYWVPHSGVLVKKTTTTFPLFIIH